MTKSPPSEAGHGWIPRSDMATKFWIWCEDSCCLVVSPQLRHTDCEGICKYLEPHCRLWFVTLRRQGFHAARLRYRICSIKRGVIQSTLSAEDR